VRTTTDKSSSRSLATQLMRRVNKWRLAFLVFLLIYAVLVTLGLSTAPMQWDEVVHLNDGALLLRGENEQLNYFYPPLFDGVTMIGSCLNSPTACLTEKPR
jgi:hypothetical protein